MPLGVHTSIAGGISKSIERAALLGCDAMQIFGRNPRSWVYSPLPGTEAALFRAKRKDSGIAVVAVHTDYLINLCSPDDDIYFKSIDMFQKELGIAEAIGADYLVTHLGSPQDMGDEFAIRRVISALGETAKSGLVNKTRVLLENTAGAGYGFGKRLSDIGRIVEGAARAGLEAGLCFDTCHAFAAGYSFAGIEKARALVKTIEAEIGMASLKLIHLNDSKGTMESNLDRHEHIGKGKIGLEAFRALLNLPGIKEVPMVLETPKKSQDDDPMNLRTVRELLGIIGS